MNKGYWNGQAAMFRVVVIKVGEEPEVIRLQCEAYTDRKRFLWFKPFVNTERQAIEVHQGTGRFYIDNADGTGLLKVTEGLGSPTYGHRSVYPDQVLREVPEEHWQVFDPVAVTVVNDEINEAWMAIDPEGYTKHKKDVEALLARMKQFKNGHRA
jgi:hypothetical protein